MQKEIVFRVWDSEQKRFLYSNVDELRFNENGWSIGEYNLYSELKCGVNDNYDNALLQQFTGLKDKNGKEIYEGDIVKRFGVTKAVEYKNGKSFCGFNIGAGYNYTKSGNSMEVIGNIHENPELLNQK